MYTNESPKPASRSSLTWWEHIQKGIDTVLESLEPVTTDLLEAQG